MHNTTSADHLTILDVRRFKEGDTATISAMFQPGSPLRSRVERSVRARVWHSAHDDAVSEAFIKIMQGRSRFRGTTPGELLAWSGQVATRAAVDEMRSSARFDGLIDRVTEVAPPAASVSVENALVDELDLREFGAELSVRDRAILEARLDGYSYPEIDEQMAQAPNWSANRVRSMKKRLRTHLESFNY